MLVLPEGLPDAVLRLPRDPRGYPIPWFVTTLPDGSRDLRLADGGKRRRAFEGGLCWVCGSRLGRDKVFVGGPWSCTNRVFGDWCAHPECAVAAAKVCPVLNGTMVRRSARPMPDFPAHAEVVLPGNMTRLSPWAGLYLTRKPVLVDEDGLFRPGPPKRLDWWREGRQMTPDEVREQVRPRLARIAAFLRGELEDVDVDEL